MRAVLPRVRLIALLGASPLAAVCLPQIANAQTCTFAIQDLNFGPIDGLFLSTTETTATLTAICTGTPGANLKVCPNLGEGTGGADSLTRFMTSGTNSVRYSIRYSNGTGTRWGSYLWPYVARSPRIDISLGILGTGTATATLYGRIPTGQPSVPPGVYTSFMSGVPNVAMDYQYGSGGNCNTQMSGAYQRATTSFTARTLILGGCTVAASTLDFGTQGLLDTARDASANLSVTCPLATSYTVGLGPGSAGGGAAPTARTMRLGVDAVTYGLYRDAARSLAWGSTTGLLYTGTGSGLAQSIPVYGRVPVQDTPPAGTYTDTVVVTVTY